ncbi:chlamydia polymorphic membrane middle domain protein, partial [Chlamydia psittaci C19/98]
KSHHQRCQSSQHR